MSRLARRRSWASPKTAARTGLVASWATFRIASAIPIASVWSGVKMAITESTAGSASTASRAARYSSGPPIAVMSMGLPMAAAGLSTSRRRRRGIRAQLGQGQPGSLAGVRGEDAGTARVADHGDPVAGGQGRRGDHPRDVEQLLQRGRPG